MTNKIEQLRPALSAATGGQCGDGRCEQRSETCHSCPLDCGGCVAIPTNECVVNGTFTFTFDDGPTSITPRVLDVLKAYNVTATFFVTAQNLEDPTYARYVRRAVQEGHVVGAHTYYHKDLTTLSDEQLFADLTLAHVAIASATGVAPKLFRSPYGNYNKRTLAVAQAFGYIPVTWSFDSRDTMMVYKSAEDPGALFSRLHLFDDKDNTPGIISLHHDLVPANADILEQMVQQVPLCEFTIIDMETCLGTSISRYNDRKQLFSDVVNC
ncbi:hypothetical protein DFJ73DRAFT_666280 [Zopfochytrium polystomum]|nr:hypothetical protein DFJ73DRAFT_666280 [Zopfochytrium polystomum]